MGKVKLLLDVIGDLRSLADSLQAVADAGVHELVQCRIFFQSNPSFRGVVAYL